MISKGKLMELTGNNRNVDSALPESLLATVEKLGFNRDEILFSYGYSYKNNLLGRPISIPMAFLGLLEERMIQFSSEDDSMIKASIMDLVLGLLESPSDWDIRLR